MRDTLIIQMPHFIQPINKVEKHIQILFSGNAKGGHWICSYYDGLRIYIYDSVNAGCLNVQQRDFKKTISF